MEAIIGDNIYIKVAIVLHRTPSFAESGCLCCCCCSLFVREKRGMQSGSPALAPGQLTQRSMMYECQGLQVCHTLLRKRCCRDKKVILSSRKSMKIFRSSLKRKICIMLYYQNPLVVPFIYAVRQQEKCSLPVQVRQGNC